jgi:hypothetical protein
LLCSQGKAGRGCSKENSEMKIVSKSQTKLIKKVFCALAACGSDVKGLWCLIVSEIREVLMVE